MSDLSDKLYEPWLSTLHVWHCWVLIGPAFGKYPLILWRRSFPYRPFIVYFFSWCYLTVCVFLLLQFFYHSSLESIHCGWQWLPLHRWMQVLMWLRRSMSEKHCLPQCGHWWTESWIGQSTAACWCLRLYLRSAARWYSASMHVIPKVQVDRQVALIDARASSLLNGMLHLFRDRLDVILEAFLLSTNTPVA